MGTQNQAIGKSKGGMATKRLVVLPRGERPTPTTSTTSPPLFQFALPRGERRAGCHGRGTVLQVSIRAPAWGATFVVCVLVEFQFALPRGERLL